MTGKLLNTLLRQATDRFPAPAMPAIRSPLASLGAPSLAPLYETFNGGYFFGGALEIFPVGTSHYTEIESWNDAAGWRKDFDQDLDGIVFFAHDLFCFPYGVRGEAVVRLNHETGEIEPMAATLTLFLEQLLDECDYYSGQSLLAEWEEEHGPLPIGQRLFAKMPFVLGGDWETDNLWASEPLPVLAFRAFCAKHLKGKADGTRVSISLPNGKRLRGVLQR